MQTSPTSSPTSTPSCGEASRPRPAAALALGAALIAILGSPAALANGRYPSARFMTFGPGDSSPLIGLQTTFGYVFSRDAGKTWQLRCEEAIGFESTETWDPPLLLTESRAIAGLPLGLAVAGQSTCTFDRAVSVPDEPIVDLASDATGQKVVAAMGPLSTPNAVMLSDDGGSTWRAGGAIPSFLMLTIDVAPNRPQRLYVSGLINNNIGALFRSDDGGATFTETTRAFGLRHYVYISAVDPRNPEVVYVRVDLPDSTATVLSRSDDGGATFRELRRSGNGMTGFAMSADGQTLWVGSPGDLPDDGVHRSSDGGETWTPMSGGHVVLCLRQHDGILYMCTPPENNGGVALACSGDDGATFNPVLTWADLAGPESCPAGTPGRDLCEPGWDALRSRLIPDGGLPPVGPRGCTRAPATDAAPDAPAATPDAGPDAPTPDVAPARSDASPTAPPPSSDGCTCTLTPRASPQPWPLALLLTALYLRHRRRTR
jgi:MYXO-CTERM domain-containing protein